MRWPPCCWPSTTPKLVSTCARRVVRPRPGAGCNCWRRPAAKGKCGAPAEQPENGKTGTDPIFPHSGRRREATERRGGRSRRAMRGASPTLSSPPGRDLLTLQTRSPNMSDATVLFADVSGSTRLIETAGDAVALKAIARCIERLRKAAESTGGQVVKTIGDEVMVLFPTPDAAVQAAAKMHASINALPAVGDTKLGVHVGFHSGPVIQVEKDVLGDTVKLAAKLVEQAQKGQTITSQQTAALLSPALKPYSHELRELAVREQGDGVWLCEIVSQAASTAIVRLNYRDQAVECTREHPSVVIGREYGCGVLVADRTASRKHCTIELRGGQFVVQDHSTNGTYVTVDSEKSVLLKGDDLALRRFGWIGFSDVRYAGSDVVQFSCG